MNVESTAEGLIERGRRLLLHHRFKEAESHFRQALAQNPDDSLAYEQLAISLYGQEKHADALAAIDRAVSLRPQASELFALRSFILGAAKRRQEALAAADEAVRLDPASEQAFSAKAAAHLGLEQWRAAEDAARQALALDADDLQAANLLSTALRLQRKTAENAAQIAGMLERDPEDSNTHASAGWNALQRGDRRQAEVHFREALRLRPSNENARLGVIEAFKARSPLYRGYLAWCFYMASLSPKARWGLVIGLMVFANLASKVARGPWAPVGIAVVALYLVLVLWSHVARGVGNFMLMFDRFARLALLREERLEALAVGGSLAAGVAVVIASLAAGVPGLLNAGIALIAAAFPLAHTFTNESVAGRWLFGTFSAICASAVVALLLAGAFPVAGLQALAKSLFVLGWLAGIATTWLSGVRSLR